MQWGRWLRPHETRKGILDGKGGALVSTSKFNQLEVRTPEGVVFNLHLAGPVLRFSAWLIDLLIIIVLLNTVSYLVNILRVISPELGTAFNVIAYFVLIVGYAIFCEWLWRGQTVGKRLFRIRVVDELGLKLRFSQILLRNLLRVLDAFPFLYLVGGTALFLSRKYQRLGDLVAGTVVIRMKRQVEPDIHEIIRGKYNSLRAYPHLIARLRQHVSPEDVATAVDALLRRNRLEKQARLKIFSNLAAYFRCLVNLPEKAVEGLSDEQLVANLVDVLYRREDGKPKKAERQPQADLQDTQLEAANPN